VRWGDIHPRERLRRKAKSQQKDHCSGGRVAGVEAATTAALSIQGVDCGLKDTADPTTLGPHSAVRPVHDGTVADLYPRCRFRCRDYGGFRASRVPFHQDTPYADAINFGFDWLRLMGRATCVYKLLLARLWRYFEAVAGRFLFFLLPSSSPSSSMSRRSSPICAFCCMYRGCHRIEFLWVPCPLRGQSTRWCALTTDEWLWKRKCVSSSKPRHAY